MQLTIKIDDKAAILSGGLANEIGMARKFGMINLVSSAEALAVKEAPVQKGNLAGSRTSHVSEDGSAGTITFTATYAGFVHGGTGLFGPLHKRIAPTTKKALFWPGAKHPVRSIAGMRPNPWIERALGKLNAQKEFEQGISNYLKNRGW